MSAFSKIISNVIYIQCLLQMECQYTDIWSDTMEQNNGWTGYGSDIEFAYSSKGCFLSLCLRTRYKSYVIKSTNINSRYSSLQLQYDVSTDDSYAGDTCNVYYAYDSTSAKQLIAVIDPPDGASRHFYPNETVTLPSSVSKSTVYIWLEADVTCYWNNVFLKGIIKTSTGQPIKAASTLSLSTTVRSTYNTVENVLYTNDPSITARSTYITELELYAIDATTTASKEAATAFVSGITAETSTDEQSKEYNKEDEQNNLDGVVIAVLLSNGIIIPCLCFFSYLIYHEKRKKANAAANQVKVELDSDDKHQVVIAVDAVTKGDETVTAVGTLGEDINNPNIRDDEFIVH